MALSERSLRNLDGVHPDLVRVVKLAAEREDWCQEQGVSHRLKQRISMKTSKQGIDFIKGFESFVHFTWAHAWRRSILRTIASEIPNCFAM